jgi:hypothetical protein
LSIIIDGDRGGELGRFRPHKRKEIVTKKNRWIDNENTAPLPCNSKILTLRDLIHKRRGGRGGSEDLRRILRRG